jgi:hypothetical protein
MIVGYAAALSGLALVLLAAPARAGPCTQEIYDFDILLNKKLDAAAAAGKSGAQSMAATAHRQPTLKSVEQAEVQLGDISPANAQAFTDAMVEARKADVAGDRAGCEKALNAAKSMLNR